MKEWLSDPWKLYLLVIFSNAFFMLLRMVGGWDK